MTTVPLGFGDRQGPLPGHICLFHETETELRAAQLAFLWFAVHDPRQGILLLGPPGAGRRLLSALESDLGRSLADEVTKGRLVVAEAAGDGDEQLERYMTALDSLSDRGYEVIRAFGRASWDTPGFAPPEDFLWIESKLNEIVALRRTIMLCAYDLGELPVDALVYGGLETHPLYVLGSELLDSPLYVEPAEYLKSRLLRLPWITPVA
jgi:hypothetical protein